MCLIGEEGVLRICFWFGGEFIFNMFCIGVGGGVLILSMFLIGVI